MTNLFKQVWPLIKSKVKDPSLLIKTITAISSEADEDALVQIEEQSGIIQDMESQLT